MMNDEWRIPQGNLAPGLERLARADPRWVDIVAAAEVMPGGMTLLHAGPPFETPHEVPRPVLNSLVLASIYEGWAEHAGDAEAMLLAGDVSLVAAQDCGVVVPLASAVSPRMKLAAVEAGPDQRARAFVPIHEGIVHGSLFGRLDREFMAHRSWIDGELTDWLRTALLNPIRLLPILLDSLDQADDGHSRVLAGSQTLVAELSRRAEQAPPAVRDFLGQSPGFALNLWMATAAALLSVVDGIPGATLVTRAGGNGVRFGLQVSGAPGEWLTVDSPPVRGPVSQDAEPLPAIGDSAVIDFLGLGGQTLATAHVVREDLRDWLPDDVTRRPEEILAFKLGSLGGRQAVADVRRVVEHGRGPLVLLGILDGGGLLGRIGAGVAEPPQSLFEQAVDAINTIEKEVTL